MAENIEASPSAKRQNQVNEDMQLVRILCMNLRPCYKLEEGLQELIKDLSNYTLPSIEKISEDLIPAAFDSARLDVKKILETVHHVAISIETWQWGMTDERNMFTATAHFVYQSQLVSQTLFTIDVKVQTVENIASVIEEELIEWEVLQKVVCFVTSAGNNGNLLRKAARTILKIPHQFCIAESINMFIQDSLSNVRFEELEVQCRNDNLESLFTKKKNEPFGWHNQYNVLKYICENNVGDFTADEREELGEFFQLLKPFEDLNNKFSMQQYLPLSKLIHVSTGLKSGVSKCAPNSFYVKVLREKLKAIDIRYDIANGLALKAAFMDPRFKTLALSQEVAKDLQQKLILELNIHLKNNEHNPAASISNNQSQENENQLGNLTNDHDDIVESYSRAKSIVSFYNNIPDSHPDKDPFKFWNEFNRFCKCSEFYMMSQKYLCIPAIATPVESFSGEFPWMKVSNNKRFYERRNLLEYENINKVLFLHSYYTRIEK